MFSTTRPTGEPVDGRGQIDKAFFALIFCSLGPLAFIAPKGLWIPVLLLLSLRSKSLMALARPDCRDIAARNAVYLTLPLYAVLSATWAVVPADAAITGAKLLGYLITMVIVTVAVDRLSAAEKRQVVMWGAAGIVVIHLLVWVDLGTAGVLSNSFRNIPFTANFYSPGAAVSACAVLPLAVGLYRLRGPRLASAFAAISVVTIFLLANEAAQFAVVLGSFAFAVVRWRRVLFWPIVLLPLTVGILSPAFFAGGFSDSLLCTTYDAKASAAHRLVIYAFSSQKIYEKPLIGWGMDASRSIPGGSTIARIHDCSDRQGGTGTRSLGTFLPLHPHNGSLQVWLELGAVGVVIFLGLLGRLIWRWQRGYESSDGRPLIAGQVTAIFLIYNISFGLWQGWLIFALILLCAIIRTIQNGVSASDGGVTRN